MNINKRIVSICITLTLIFSLSILIVSAAGEEDISSGTPPKITTESLPDGDRGSLYSQTLSATGDAAITWSISKGSLPAGFTLNGNTGVISGTPASAGTFGFTVKASSGAGTDEKSFTVSIKEPAPASVSGVSLYPASATVAEGGSVVLTATVYPAGAENRAVAWFSDNIRVATVTNGAVTGVSQGTATVTVITIDGGYIASCAVTVTGELSPPAITTANLPNGSVGKAYSQTLEATGGAPFAWSVSGGSLPYGLTLNPQTGAVSGTPTAIGTFSFTVRVSNGMNPDASKSFSITVTAAGESWDDYPDDPLYRYWDNAGWNNDLFDAQYDENWYDKKADDWSEIPSGDEVCRYIVLVLDVSGSMKGKPLTELKKASDAFCGYILKADEGNRIAIVAYSSKARILQNFTNDYKALSAVIDSLKSGGSANIYDGLDCADKLLDSVSANLYAAKQVFLMSDGLPNAGSASNSGTYTNADYSGYRYANAVSNKANEMKSKGCNMLTLGFFHANVKSEFIPDRLRFAIKFMETDLPCEGFRNRMTVINNPDDLVSRFIAAAEMLNGIPSMCGEQAETPQEQLRLEQQSEPFKPAAQTEAQPTTQTQTVQPEIQPQTEATEQEQKEPAETETQPQTEGEEIYSPDTAGADKLPQTGMMYLPLPLCGAVSALAVILGLVLNRRRKVRKLKPKIFVLILGVLPILLSVGVAAYNYWDESRADTAAVWTTLTLRGQIGEYEEEKEDDTAFNDGNASCLIELDGELYTGILSIPSLDLELPINNELNDEKLKTSPCRYSGDISNSMTIAAHNYKNHFGRVSELMYGDTVAVTDAKGNEHYYAVEMLTVLNESEVEAMVNTPYSLTLFTCTADRRNRITVRCAEITGTSDCPPFPEYEIKQGQSGGNVRLMQKYLNEIRSVQPDLPLLTEDGSFGPSTKKAVQTFQNLYGLNAGGIIEKTTWDKIAEVYGGLQ